MARVVRTRGAIAIDGRLDEADWTTPPPVTEFTQLDPREGEPASERTEVRILYDAEALYIGARLHDAGPVSSRLARRDAVVIDSDWLIVSIDSYHDHLTAFRFSINPAGVRRDDVYSSASARSSASRDSEPDGDTSWDPVWEASAEVTDSGWVAELRIPFSQLRFTPEAVQTWGIQLERFIARKQEQAVFAFTPKLERAGVARYGHLSGLEGIEARDRLEILPYLLGQAAYRQSSTPAGVSFPDPYRSAGDFGGGLGLDLKYRVTSNFTVNATVNPDFGQVEVDPAVINLTAFETRYEEKRPFFVEGADIFRFGSARGTTARTNPASGLPQLLYSRRIGRSPQLSIADEAVYHDAPEATTILGAAKLTGQTPGGWALGLLEAVTDRERARFVGEDGFADEGVVEPLSNYLVGRLKRDLNGGRTSIGGLLTSVHRRLDQPGLEENLRRAAYAGGIDFRHEGAARVWSVSGFVSPSLITGSPDAIRDAQRSSARYFQRPDAEHLELDPDRTTLGGYLAQIDVGKRAGAWVGNVELGAISPGYEVNDLGFQTIADRVILETSASYQQNRPGEVFRQWRARARPEFTWNFAGQLVASRLESSLTLESLNYWYAALAVQHQLGSWNDRLTRGGPLTRNPARSAFSLDLISDPRRSYLLDGEISYEEDAAGARESSAKFVLSFNPANNLTFSVGPELVRERIRAQYLTTIPDPTAVDTDFNRYVFAGLDQTTLGVEARVNVTFTPALTFELYAQPFLSSGDYEDPKELRAPRTFEFLRYGADIGSLERPTGAGFVVDPDGPGSARAFRLKDEDFNFHSLRGNAVLRWEWRQGSTLYLVWQQDRSAEIMRSALDRASSGVGEFHLGDDARALLKVRPDNILLVKVSYWLNP